MSLTRMEMDRAVDEHFKYEAEDDIEGVLSTLAADVTHDIVGWPAGPTQGRENARPFYEALFADLTESTAATVKRLYGENFVVDESFVEFKAVGRPFGVEGKGRTVRTRLLHVIEFASDGMIKRENAWIDMAALMQQLSPGA
ncbi:MAG TPA: ester cyclase [Acidobacteriaceae bacterium]|jgi:predicted ester cyclase|nr:ester cyclase [Acidobacteriaceae bacterium]